MNLQKSKKRSGLSLILTLCLATTLIACSKDNTNNSNAETPTPMPTPIPTITETVNEKISKSSFKLNTVITITLYDSQDMSIIDECFALCDTYEDLLSRTRSNSDIYKLNESNGSPLTLSDDTLELLNAGIKYSELSNGAFDISVEPLTSLWNFGSSNQRLPGADEIATAITHIGYKDIEINGNEVTLTNPDMGIDLGAIAKGYIADKMKEFLISKGVNSAVINLGGNVLCVGNKPSGEPFLIGIQKPYEDRNETVAAVELKDKSVVSSGIYERYFVVDGVYYHHILNPFTGYPYDNDILSVTIISDKSVDGDALSTTCFALGLEKGMELIDSMEDTYCVYITKDDTLHYSKGFLENFKVIETN